MTVTVLFFAHYQDVVGEREQRVTLSDPANVSDLADVLIRQYPDLTGMLSYARVAVNADHADPNTILHDDDEVALMPPMSGGAGKN
jgi:molybdopterin converting factor subunit 1